MRILLLFIIAVLVSCKDSDRPNYTKKDANTVASNDKGEKLMKAYCYSCHTASVPHEARMAPPMFAVKNHYKSASTTKEEFIAQFTSFTLDPTEEKSKMRGAIKRFGLMPKQYFKKEDVEAIAAYIYDNPLEKPKGYDKNHGEKQHGKGKGMHQNNKSKKEFGYSIATKTKQKLAKNLIGTIQKEGTVAALKFCNVQAYPLTNEMATVLNAEIKRVSDKPRNPKNKANKKEIGFIAHFQNMIDNDVFYEPIIENLSNGKTQFYAPIVTNQMCLQCHGSANDIHKKTLNTITTLYPDDMAKGYSVNQVRGLWRIEF